jgi:hypothetical protein
MGDDAMSEHMLDQVDRLLHDAEHANGGAQFAASFMHDIKNSMSLAEKRDRLIREALALDPKRLCRSWEDAIELAPYIAAALRAPRPPEARGVE